MSEQQPQPYTVTQGLEIMPPRAGKAYPIPCDEWDMLKNKVKTLSNEPWLFQNLGSVFVGAAGSTLIAVLGGNPPPTQKDAVTIAWAVTVTTAILGAVCWFFGDKERKIHRDRASDVVAQMELIEKRYK